MAARMRQLTPQRSTSHLLGAMIRQGRCERGLSQAALGRLVLVSAALIRKVEHAERFPHDDLLRAIETVLGTGGVLRTIWLRAQVERTLSTSLGHSAGVVRLRAAARHRRVAGLLTATVPLHAGDRAA